jgi:hypothetical protein
VGDFIAFHGWYGKPYHSPWSFRTAYMQIRYAEPITVRKDSIYFPEGKIGSVPCKSAVKACDLNHLASLDGIDPATGEELIRVLHAMHGGGTLHCKILRWDPTPIKEQRIKEIAPFIIKPDPSQIDGLGRIKMCEGDFTRVEQVHATVKETTDPFRVPTRLLVPESKDFVQLGAFDKQAVQ